MATILSSRYIVYGCDPPFTENHCIVTVTSSPTLGLEGDIDTIGTGGEYSITSSSISSLLSLPIQPGINIIDTRISAVISRLMLFDDGYDE